MNLFGNSNFEFEAQTNPKKMIIFMSEVMQEKRHYSHKHPWAQIFDSKKYPLNKMIISRQCVKKCFLCRTKFQQRLRLKVIQEKRHNPHNHT